MIHHHVPSYISAFFGGLLFQWVAYEFALKDVRGSDRLIAGTGTDVDALMDCSAHLHIRKASCVKSQIFNQPVFAMILPMGTATKAKPAISPMDGTS